MWFFGWMNKNSVSVMRVRGIIMCMDLHVHVHGCVLPGRAVIILLPFEKELCVIVKISTSVRRIGVLHSFENDEISKSLVEFESPVFFYDHSTARRNVYVIVCMSLHVHLCGYMHVVFVLPALARQGAELHL
jgi:hypothetical protein